MWQSSVFTWFYLGVAAIVFVAALAHRRRVLDPPSRLRAHEISPAHVAFLGGDRHLALYPSLAALRAMEVVGLTADRKLTTTGPLPAGATALDRAVHAAAEGGVPQQLLRADPAVRAAVDGLGDELARANLLLRPEIRRSARRGAWLMLLLLAVGVTRLGSGIPTAQLLTALVLVLIGYLVLVVRIPRRSRAADALLEQLRHDHRHLAPSYRPELRGQAPDVVAMAVALYGMEAMSGLDPLMAEEAERERRSLIGTAAHPGDAGAYGFTGFGGGSSGDSRGCGGGSGDSGGGSSCGGSGGSSGGGGGCGGGGGGGS